VYPEARLTGIAAALRPGGVFVLADVVVPDDPRDAQIPIDREMDLPDRLRDQLDWLREASFAATTIWAQRDLAIARATRASR